MIQPNFCQVRTRLHEYDHQVDPSSNAKSASTKLPAAMIGKRNANNCRPLPTGWDYQLVGFEPVGECIALVSNEPTLSHLQYCR